MEIQFKMPRTDIAEIRVDLVAYDFKAEEGGKYVRIVEVPERNNGLVVVSGGIGMENWFMIGKYQAGKVVNLNWNEANEELRLLVARLEAMIRRLELGSVMLDFWTSGIF